MGFMNGYLYIAFGFLLVIAIRLIVFFVIQKRKVSSINDFISFIIAFILLFAGFGSAGTIANDKGYYEPIKYREIYNTIMEYNSSSRPKTLNEERDIPILTLEYNDWLKEALQSKKERGKFSPYWNTDLSEFDFIYIEN